MTTRRTLARWLAGAAILLAARPASLPAQRAGEPEHWVATWATAQELYRAPPPQPNPTAAPAAQPGAQPAPPRPEGQGFRISRTINNQTVRMVVRPSIGGPRARIRLANAFGAPTVTVGAAAIAVRGAGPEIVAGTSRPLTFGGKSSVTLVPGAVVLSDPVEMTVTAGRDLAVSLFLPGEAGRPTAHSLGLHDTYVSRSGDFTGAARIDPDTTTLSYYWLAAVDVTAPADAAAVVGFGDSITDGAVSTPNTDRMWPAVLAARIASSPAAGKVAVVNAGISGNQVLRDASGVSALARLDRDVLSQSGVKWMILLEGINDIGNLGRAGSTSTLTADELIWAYRQIIDRAHARGVKVIGATLTPFEGAGYFSERGEAVRAAVNAWVRTPGNFDAVIDFDAITRDPANPRRFRPEYDPGDHLHPNDAGYRAMADAIDLSVFR